MTFFLFNYKRGCLIALRCPLPPNSIVNRRIIRSPGGQPVYIPVKHAKCGGNQNGIVDLLVRSPLLPRSGNVLRLHLLSTLLNLTGNGQQRFHFVGDLSRGRIALYLLHEVFIPVKLILGNRSMRVRAIFTFIPAGGIGGIIWIFPGSYTKIAATEHPERTRRNNRKGPLLIRFLTDHISGWGIAADEIIIMRVANQSTPYRLRISPYYLRIMSNDCRSIHT